MSPKRKPRSITYRPMTLDVKIERYAAERVAEAIAQERAEWRDAVVNGLFRCRRAGTLPVPITEALRAKLAQARGAAKR